jgi:hypothetical protein
MTRGITIGASAASLNWLNKLTTQCLERTTGGRMLTNLRFGELQETLSAVERWLAEYICQPHELLGRDGPVCPFVAPAQRARSLEARVRLLGPAPSRALIAELIRCALEEFHQIRWRGSNPTLRGLLVVLPDLPEDRLTLLDDAHREVKPDAVHRGMMIGQFHARCPEPAARNLNFPISRCPVPLVAFRSMALHDVLFLWQRKEWFEEYLRRFGGRYQMGKDAIDPRFVELFEKARADYGLDGLEK